MQTIGTLTQTLSQPSQDNDSQPYQKGVPDSWLMAAELVFEQLSIHYGAARMAAHWNGINPDKAKAYWGRKLMHMRRESIGYAMRHLPNNPPTVEEFCAIASRCPPPTFKALPFKLTEEDRQRGRERLAKIREMFK